MNQVWSHSSFVSLLFPPDLYLVKVDVKGKRLGLTTAHFSCQECPLARPLPQPTAKVQCSIDRIHKNPVPGCWTNFPVLCTWTYTGSNVKITQSVNTQPKVCAGWLLHGGETVWRTEVCPALNSARAHGFQCQQRRPHGPVGISQVLVVSESFACEFLCSCVCLTKIALKPIK